MYAKINNIPYIKPIKKNQTNKCRKHFRKEKRGTINILCLIICKGLKMNQANNSYSSVLVIVSILTHSWISQDFVWLDDGFSSTSMLQPRRGRRVGRFEFDVELLQSGIQCCGIPGEIGWCCIMEQQ